MTNPAAPAVGSPVFQTSGAPLSAGAKERLDRALSVLGANKQSWAAAEIDERLALLGRLVPDIAKVASRWALLSARGKHAQNDSHAIGQEWGGGPYFVLREVRLLQGALRDIERFGAPRAAGGVRRLPSGRTAARVFPADVYDRAAFMGFTADVVMQEGVTPENLPQAGFYRSPAHAGKMTLVLGAGNYSGIGPGDALDALFQRGEVVLLKLSPVNDFLAPVFESAFAALIERGVLRIVAGGAEVGAYLCEHPAVDAVHVTGSDKTFDAIVFGSGEEGEQRKANRAPKLTKRVTAELGGVSPTIVVPGPWSARDVRYHAHGLASALTNNAGCNCATTRVIVQHAEWNLREKLLSEIRAMLARVPARAAYYPGAEDRQQAFLSAHPEAREYGTSGKDVAPWTFIENLDSAADDLCFRAEPFFGLFSETAIGAPGVPEFVARAVDFANERLWGQLNATLLVHPASLRDPATARAVEDAVRNLRYGTVGVNIWSGMNWTILSTPWGAFPGNDEFEVGSGLGWAHNTLMFDAAEKTVLRAPFRPPMPIPTFALHENHARTMERLTELEARPSPLALARLVKEAVRGWL